MLTGNLAFPEKKWLKATSILQNAVLGLKKPFLHFFCHRGHRGHREKVSYVLLSRFSIASVAGPGRSEYILSIFLGIETI